VFARAERLKGGKIFFDISTVGATINCLMAATLARGTSVLANAACEPEVIAVADFLTLMGARIHGAGSSNITVEGVDSLRPAEVTVLPDRIEAGTLAIAGAMTGGEITVAACRPTDLEALTAKLMEAGVKVEEGEDELRIAAPEELQGLEIVTRPYPGFPTDLQAQMMSLLCRARGVSRITETIFPERFHHVAELRRLGADIALEDNVSSVKCVSQLSGAPVMAGDLRGSAALVLAGLVAKGETTVSRVYHLDRGYERMVEKLASLGADIERVSS
jgi:UDP-N-acetylglucosamine 1-carboxyvinyltransferase